MNTELMNEKLAGGSIATASREAAFAASRITVCAQSAEEQEASTSRLSGLPRVLRILGALSLFASATAFMLTEWVGLDSLYRYGTFLGFTVVLAIAGLFCALKLKESKGARTFLGVAAAIIPAHFAQLGALTYAQYLGTTADVPALFKFAPLGYALTVGTVVLAFVVLAAIAYGGFSVMARKSAQTLTIGYLLANAFILLPVREPAIVVTLALVLIAAVAFFDYSTLRNRTSMQTFEGYSARAMLYAPYAIIVGRSFLYGAETLTASLALVSIGALLYFGAREAGTADPERKAFGILPAVQLAGAGFMTLGTLIFTGDTIGETLDNYIAMEAAFIISLIFPLAALSRIIARYSLLSGSFYRGAGALVSTVAASLIVLNGDSIVASTLLALLSLAHIILGYTDKHRVVFYSGCGGFAVAIIYNLRFASDLFSYSPWLALAAVGMSVVLASSYLEAKLGKLVTRVSALKDEIDAW